MNPVDPKKLSLTELKALKSDIRDQMDINQQGMAIINAEIQLRLQEQAQKDAEAKLAEKTGEVAAIPQPHEETPA